MASLLGAQNPVVGSGMGALGMAGMGSAAGMGNVMGLAGAASGARAPAFDMSNPVMAQLMLQQVRVTRNLFELCKDHRTCAFGISN